MRLGATTPSHDAETEVVERTDPSGGGWADLEDVRDAFLDTID
jgi:hypothetical protein